MNNLPCKDCTDASESLDECRLFPSLEDETKTTSPPKKSRHKRGSYSKDLDTKIRLWISNSDFHQLQEQAMKEGTNASAVIRTAIKTYLQSRDQQ